MKDEIKDLIFNTPKTNQKRINYPSKSNFTIRPGSDSEISIHSDEEHFVPPTSLSTENTASTPSDLCMHFESIIIRIQ